MTQTFAIGEPSSRIGGGTPACVVEITVEPRLCRASLRVLRNEGGGYLPSINRRDGRGAQPMAAGDVIDITGRLDVEPVELLRRVVLSPVGGGEWRAVTAETPWWNGREFVAA